jgi:hypothetical protein
MIMTRFLTILSILSTLSILAAGCTGQPEHDDAHAYQLAPLTLLPGEMRSAPATVREAYQFAVYNVDVLAQLPCYCGCGAMGHTSNYSCYIQEGSREGDIAFDDHALGCSICVDITQDAMRLLDAGKSVEQIYDYVDAAYSRFGPPTPLR